MRDPVVMMRKHWRQGRRWLAWQMGADLVRRGDAVEEVLSILPSPRPEKIPTLEPGAPAPHVLRFELGPWQYKRREEVEALLAIPYYLGGKRERVPYGAGDRLVAIWVSAALAAIRRDELSLVERLARRHWSPKHGGGAERTLVEYEAFDRPLVKRKGLRQVAKRLSLVELWGHGGAVVLTCDPLASVPTLPPIRPYWERESIRETIDELFGGDDAS